MFGREKTYMSERRVYIPFISFVFANLPNVLYLVLVYAADAMLHPLPDIHFTKNLMTVIGMARM